MIIVNAILYLSSSQLFIIQILSYWFVAKNIGNYRKCYIFFNFRFTGNMIFPSFAENQEKMIFTLSVFTKMLFFMQWSSLEYFVVRVKVLNKTFSRLCWLLIMDHKVILPIHISSLMTVSLTLFRMGEAHLPVFPF